MAFFLWAASSEKILIVDNLRKCNIIPVSWCYIMCKGDGEMVDHLLLHFPFDRELWDMVFTLFGVHWAMPGRVFNLLASWQGCFGRHRNSEIWKAIPHCLMCCFWRERNARNLGCERLTLDLNFHFLRTLLEWSLASRKFSFSNLLEFLDHCSFKA